MTEFLTNKFGSDKKEHRYFKIKIIFTKIFDKEVKIFNFSEWPQSIKKTAVKKNLFYEHGKLRYFKTKGLSRTLPDLYNS